MSKPKLPPKDFEWNPKLAYAVGLLVTDGNLSRDGRHITMCSVDRDLLEVFSDCIGLKNNRISKTYYYNDRNKEFPCYRLQFSKIQFYNWLIKIGLTPAKSLNIGPIKIPDNFFRDFLRGHLDGDGSIYTYKDKQKINGRIYRNQRVYTKLISASQNHIKWLYGKINKLTGIRCALSHRIPIYQKRAPLYEIKFAKKSSLELWKWIYYKRDLPCLRRKRIKAEMALKIISKERKEKYTRLD